MNRSNAETNASNILTERDHLIGFLVFKNLPTGSIINRLVKAGAFANNMACVKLRRLSSLMIPITVEGAT